MSDHYIEFRNVYKTFDYPVLVDVNFHVDAGHTLAIIGRSGVGKSVSLGHIMGFLKPDSGRVIVSYQDITDFSEAELRAMAEHAARQVRATSAAFVFGPMEPSERRVIHLSLATEEDLFTESIGEGNGRRLRVSLKAASTH